jgi:hypothetical protein
MNENLLPFINEAWIKINWMIVDLKSLKRGFLDERHWHEDWDYQEYEKQRQKMWEVKPRSDLTVLEYCYRFGGSQSRCV